MRYILVSLLFQLFLCSFSEVSKSQQHAENTSLIASISVADTLTDADWLVFDNYADQQKWDSAYLVIGKKLTNGKHRLTAEEIKWRLHKLIDAFDAVNKTYQLQNLILSLKEKEDSSVNLKISQRFYKDLSHYYARINDWKNAFSALKISDSLFILINQYTTDSIISANKKDLDLANTNIEQLNMKLDTLQESEKHISTYHKITSVAAALLFLISLLLAVLLFRSSKNKKEKNQDIEIKPSGQHLQMLAQHLQMADYVNTLMLQKGRTGEDLTYLKILESSIISTRNEYFSSEEIIVPDSDQIFKKLKFIRITIIGSQTAELMLLKDLLKRTIRLTEIFITENLNAETLSQQVHAYIIIEPHHSLSELHHLPEVMKSKIITIGYQDVYTLKKPFHITALIRELMKLYTYAEQEPVVQHHTFIQNTAGTSPKQHFIEMLQDVQIRNNRDELFKLLSQIKKANETHTALVNQIDKLTEHYDTLNALQIELALRNISSYLGMS